MINSLSSMSQMSSMSMSSQAMKGAPPPPQDGDAFKIADSDANGTVNGTELETLVEGISEVSGSSLSSEDALANYDSDGDGGLSGEELMGLLSNSGFATPTMVEGEDGLASEMQPPPPPPQQVTAAYTQNSGEDNDMISMLMDYLQSGTTEESTEINVAV